MKINADGVKRRDAFSVPPELLTLVTDIDHPLYDPRVHDPLPEAFVENIAQDGIHTPVIIRKVGKGADEKLEVVDGRQRVRAALQINQRRRGIRRDPIEVPCVVKTDVEEALFAASISCNEARRNDGLLEKAAKAQRLRDNGLSLKSIAVKFCVQPQTVEFWLELLSLAKEVRDEIKAGTITATAAREFVGLNREGQIELLGRVLAEAEPEPAGGISTGIAQAN